MTNSIRSKESGQRRGDSNALRGKYSNDASLSSTSSASFHDSVDVRTMIQDSASRQLLREEVTKLQGDTCSLTTSLRTGYKGWSSASGIMFTVQPSIFDVELLTLEFPTFENFGSDSSDPTAARKVKVYYRLGDFSNFLNDPSAWTLLADTSAQLTPPVPAPGSADVEGLDMGAIVPADEFESVTLKAGQKYAIYIQGAETEANPKETLLKVKPADGLVGDIYTKNDSLEVSTGVRLKGSPFPSKFSEAADFNGILHYRVEKSCKDGTMFTITEIPLEFAVNKDPNSDVMGKVRKAVDETVAGWFSQNEKLIQYSKDYKLIMEGLAVNFTGRSREKCPIDFSDCSLVTTTLSFKHLPNLDPGLLEMEIFRHHDDLDKNVYSMVSPLETSYVEIPLSKAEFAITLSGTPVGDEMNEIQRRYFEEITLNFLRQSVKRKGEMFTPRIFNAVVSSEMPEIPFTEDGESPEEENGRRMLRPVVARQRKVQDNYVGKLQIITEIAAEGDVPGLRNIVLEGIGLGADELTLELISQQMRPIEINEQEEGAFFAGLTNVHVKPHVPKPDPNVVSTPDGNGGSGESKPSTSTRPVEDRGSLWVIVCILLIVFSLLWLLYRIYIDCFYSPNQKAVKLTDDKKDSKDGKDEFKDEEEESVRSGFFNNPLSDLLKSAPFTAESNTKDKPKVPRARSFPNLLATGKEADTGNEPKRGVGRKFSFNFDSIKPKSLSNTAPVTLSRSSSRSGSSRSFAGDSDEELSVGDMESSDEESIESPRRSRNKPQRGKLVPAKSLPVQQRKPPKDRKSLTKSSLHGKSPREAPSRLLSGPTRGKLTPSKSMPLQNRNGAGPNNGAKIPKRISTKSQHDEKTERSTPRRSPSAPTRGRLKATKSLPLQKQNQGDKKKKTKLSPKPTTPKRMPRRSPSVKRRGNLTPSKSMPLQTRAEKRPKGNPKRLASFASPSSSKENESILAKKKKFQDKNSKKGPPVTNSKKKLGKLDRASSHSETKKEDRRSTNSESRKTPKRISSKSSNPKKLLNISTHSESKELDRQSSHSYSNKIKSVEQRRSIKANKIKQRKSKRESENKSSSIKKIADMVHDSSDSDSEDSHKSLSEITRSTNSASTNSSDALRRSSHSDASNKSSSSKSDTSKKSYGKAGKIQFGGVSPRSRKLAGLKE